MGTGTLFGEMFFIDHARFSDAVLNTAENNRSSANAIRTYMYFYTVAVGCGVKAL